LELGIADDLEVTATIAGVGARPRGRRRWWLERLGGAAGKRDLDGCSATRAGGAEEPRRARDLVGVLERVTDAQLGRDRDDHAVGFDAQLVGDDRGAPGIERARDGDCYGALADPHQRDAAELLGVVRRELELELAVRAIEVTRERGGQAVLVA